MEFAFLPDARPPRVIRYVATGSLPGRRLLAIYDYNKNLLIVDRALFGRLNKDQQRYVLRTQATAIEMEDLEGGEFIVAA